MSFAFKKSDQNPVLGPGIGTCFDVSVLFVDDRYRMWFSWRDRKAIALVESTDGINWGRPPSIALAAPSRLWKKLSRSSCEELSRPSVILHGGKYHLWYSYHTDKVSIAYAISEDGVRWKKISNSVLVPDSSWEKDAVMCPCVIFDEVERIFKMWYSGGEKYEPDAVGYATSPDGMAWKKHPENPVFVSNPTAPWEKDRVTAMHVMKEDGYYLGFYIGFANGFENSCIGLTRSKDGITNWERDQRNPILVPGPSGAWDDCNVYKPFVIRHAGLWILWYNASRRSDRAEQIGVATCENLDFQSGAK